MMSNTEELQYGECCCCLEKGDHRELTKQYYLGKRPEIYEVLFKNTFNIVLKYPETKLICDICVVKLREANHFRFMVESSQQSLSDRVNWQPELVNGKKDPLEFELSIECIKCEPDNDMEEADYDVQPTECTTEELNYDRKATNIKENSVVEEPSQLINTVCIKHESNDDMEGVPITDHPNIQVHSDPSTSLSDKLAITRDTIKTLEVMLTPTDEVSNDSNKQQLAACEFCPYKTAHKGNLRKHIHTHTGEKPFACEICQYKTSRKGQLKVHLRTHTGEKPFSCDVCQYKTTRRSELTRHIRIHTGEKPHSCNICQLRFSIKGHLKRHILTHTGEKPFSCNICQFKSSTKDALSRHIRIHTGEKPFSCDRCQHRTSHKGDLAKHIRTHTGEKPFSCHMCNYKTAYTSGLTRHIQKHHST